MVTEQDAGVTSDLELSQQGSRTSRDGDGDQVSVTSDTSSKVVLYQIIHRL